MRVAVLIGTEKGAFVATSDAARRQWQVEGPLFKGWKVTASARSPSGRYLVATASFVYGPALHVGDDLSGLAQVEDGPAYPEGGDLKLSQIWTINAGASRHYAGVDQAGLFFSDDDGQSWQPVPGLNDHPTRKGWLPGAGGLCAHAVLVDPANAERIWCGISAVGVFRSDDGGATWVPKNEGVDQVVPDPNFPDIGRCVHGLAPDSEHADTIFRQDHSGMYRTYDGGDHWERNEAGLSSGFGFPIAMDPLTSALYAVPIESGEYRMPVGGAFRPHRSTNGGDSWEPLGNGLPPPPYEAGVLRGAMAVDGLDPGGVYLGTAAGDLFVSADGGDSWQGLPCTLPRILSVEVYVEE
ncbi:MAG TPA: exo-alpha-sialidase [Actinomycetota bacterium]|nr:exo-alpha-sialidase [Actinomycetota bacterium]